MVAQRVVVLDNGGCTCKIGFAGEEEPLKCACACLEGPISNGTDCSAAALNALLPAMRACCTLHSSRACLALQLSLGQQAPTAKNPEPSRRLT